MVPSRDVKLLIQPGCIHADPVALGTGGLNVDHCQWQEIVYNDIIIHSLDSEHSMGLGTLHTHQSHIYNSTQVT